MAERGNKNTRTACCQYYSITNNFYLIQLLKVSSFNTAVFQVRNDMGGECDF